MKSPTAIDDTSWIAVKSTLGANVPPGLPSNTETVPEPLLAAATSSRPSPFRSAKAHEEGMAPVA